MSVTLAGVVPRAEIPDFYAALDVFADHGLRSMSVLAHEAMERLSGPRAGSTARS